MLLFPITPALVLISEEEAYQKRKELKERTNKKKDRISDSDLEEAESLSKVPGHFNLRLFGKP